MTDVTSAPATAPALLVGRRMLVTGVLTPRSIAFAIADAAQRAGAEVLLTSFGRAMTLTEKSARRLDPVPDVLEMDVTRTDQVASVAAEVRRRWGGLDGAVHAVGYAPEDCLGGGFMTAPWESVAILGSPPAGPVSLTGLVNRTAALAPAVIAPSAAIHAGIY